MLKFRCKQAELSVFRCIDYSIRSNLTESVRLANASDVSYQGSWSSINNQSVMTSTTTEDSVNLTFDGMNLPMKHLSDLISVQDMQYRFLAVTNLGLVHMKST
jgi:hypothetical protein